MCRKMVYLLCFAVLLGAASSAQALTITTAKGNGADTYLSNDEQSGDYGPNSVHGTEDTFEVRNVTGLRLKIGYVRFDISDVNNKDVADVRLGVNISSATRDRVWGVYAMVDEKLDNWNEATTSYSNAPGLLAAPAGYYAIDPNVLQKVTSISVGYNPSYYESFSSTAMDSFIKSDTNKLLTFALIYDTGDADTNPDWRVTSKEGDPNLAPKLVMPNTFIPIASNPYPADGAIDVPRKVVLSCRPFTADLIFDDRQN